MYWRGDIFTNDSAIFIVFMHNLYHNKTRCIGVYIYCMYKCIFTHLTMYLCQCDLTGLQLNMHVS